MKNNTNSKTLISNYAGAGVNAPFMHNGILIQFNRIVTTLMTDMSVMFFYNTSFNEDISSWDTSNVTDMSYMFQGGVDYNNVPFNQPIGNWNVSNVTNMEAMFYGSFFNQDISGWDVTNVIPKPPANFSLSLPLAYYPISFRLDPALDNFAIINKVVGDSAFDLTAPTTFSTGTFTYHSSNTTVADISGNTVTIVGVGSTTITATQAYDNNYRSASITTTLIVSPTPIEEILGVQRSTSYDTNRLVRVYFSVANGRNPIGDTSITLQTFNGGGGYAVTSVVQAGSNSNLYYATFNTGITTVGYGFGESIQFIRILNSSRTQIYSEATNVSLGADY
jgi:surface protein